MMKNTNPVGLHYAQVVLGVLLAIFSGSMTISTAAAQSFGGAFEGMKDSNQPIQIEADRLEVEDKKGTALLSGNVNVVQGTTVLKAGTMRIFYHSDSKNASGGPNGNIKRIIASGNVAVRSGEQQATANSMVYDTQTQVVEMTGSVAISQGNDVITGCTLKVNIETSAAKLEPCKGKKKERVKLLLTPNSRTN